MVNIRNYEQRDYLQVSALYKTSELYGGQFDMNRDSDERLAKISSIDPESILVCEENGKILGTVSLIENARVAWLFRFAVIKDASEREVTEALAKKALEVLRDRGHNQVLSYAPVNQENFETRYLKLGFEKGADYTCFWKDIN